MTPLIIDIALWYYTRHTDYGNQEGDCNFNAPAVQEAFRDMVNAGLLRFSDTPDRTFQPGPALPVYVEALRAVPWPVQKWVIPEPPK